jgi:hypothetical protein
MLEIDDDHYATLVAHAKAEYPNEACALLAGRDGSVERVYALPNAEASPTFYVVAHRRRAGRLPRRRLPDPVPGRPGRARAAGLPDPRRRGRRGGAAAPDGRGGRMTPPAEGLARPVWHRQGPAARYGRCRARPPAGA